MMEEDSNENIFELQHHHLLRCLEKTTVCDHDDDDECNRDNGDDDDEGDLVIFHLESPHPNVVFETFFLFSSNRCCNITLSKALAGDSRLLQNKHFYTLQDLF